MSVSDEARKAVGDDAPQDWQLRPRAHAYNMDDTAGPLKRILTREEIEEIIEAFEDSDAAATRARNVYKTLVGWSARLSFGAMLMAALILFSKATVFETTPIGLETWIWALMALQGLMLLSSFLLSLTAGRLRPFDRWMRERASAEHERIMLFTQVLNADEPQRDGEVALLPLKLEYFRRYQLDVQRKYYRERGKEHAGAVRRSTWLRVIATLLILAAAAPIIAALVGVDLAALLRLQDMPSWSGDHDLKQRFFIAISTIGAALQGLLAAMHLMNQDERNAARYRTTAENLEALATKPLDEARAGAAANDQLAVETFITLVHEQISSEHREWVSLRALSPELSLSRLRELNLPWMR